MDGPSQAWVLGVAIPGRVLDAMVRTAQASPDRLVRLIYLMLHVRTFEDPVLTASLKSSDPLLRVIATWQQAVLEQERRRQEELQPQRP
jgi:hypothetical protein